MNVFVSSTCYDLKDARSVLKSFFEDVWKFNCYISESLDFPVDTKQHKHDAALNNVDECDIFILIIGGRFGSSYYKDNNKSITNIEFERAINLDKDIYIFIRDEVYSEYFIFKKNPDIYPTQVDDKRVFQFIDEIDNKYSKWIFKFNNVNDILITLKAQIPALFKRIHTESKTFKKSSDNIDIRYDDDTIRKKREIIINSFRNASSDNSFMLLTAIPAYTDSENIEITETKMLEILRSKYYLPSQSRQHPFIPLKYTSIIEHFDDGIYAKHIDGSNRNVVQSLAVYRNGILCYYINPYYCFNAIIYDSQYEVKEINPYFIVEFIVSLFCLFTEIIKCADIKYNYAYGLSFIRMSDYSLKLHDELISLTKRNKFLLRELKNTDIIVKKFLDPDKPINNAKLILDRLWQACKMERAPFFTMEGEFELGKYNES